MSKTLVTGIWDIKRESLSEGWSRPYSHYIEKFKELLKVPNNLIIFGDEDLKKIVFEYRNEDNTQFILRGIEWFKNNEYYDYIQKIRKDENWLNQTSWLSNSTQAKLEFYNPLVMSKPFLLNDARILSKFDDNELYWIDGGITNTVNIGYFTHDKVLYNLTDNTKINFITFPYLADREIHGFNYDYMKKLTNSTPKMVARGGFFGGSKINIEKFNTLYYNLLINTLKLGFMGTEESLFTILLYFHKELFQYYEVENNGLINKFFEDLKNGEVSFKSFEDKIDNAIYVLTFNSPKQFKTLIQSIEDYDSDMLNNSKKYLINNSTDLSTSNDYIKLCEKYDFEHIKKDNIGITGGRQFVAEHFNSTTHTHYIFFEDDMFFYNGSKITCRNGFIRKVPDILKNGIEILEKEELDFLKLNFTEFYGDNSTQFAWYNVPNEVRKEVFPNKTKLPEKGLDVNAPNTKIDKIKSNKGVPYAIGEIFLCNWPILMNKRGNYKCYIETSFKYPNEQTIMSHVFQETVKKNIKSGVLLATPTEHNRFEHYNKNLRKEN